MDMNSQKVFVSDIEHFGKIALEVFSVKK